VHLGTTPYGVPVVGTTFYGYYMEEMGAPKMGKVVGHSDGYAYCERPNPTPHVARASILVKLGSGIRGGVEV
jgi:hypothetical protein